MQGKAFFVSHQWLGYKVPDPANEQLTVLQRVVTRLMRGQIPSVQQHWNQQMHAKENLSVTAAEWMRALPHMHFWLDYSGIPGTSWLPW